MNKALLFLTLVTAAAVTGCGQRRYSPVPVSAGDFDLTPLVGRWSGDYRSPDTGRTGSIVFTLQPGEAAATGDIIMVPRNQTRSTVPLEQRLVGSPAMGTVREVLTIHFVRKDGDKVVGMLDTYRDPDCGCRVTTVFEGRFFDSRNIAGSFRTLSAEYNDLRAAGTWKVRREKTL